MQDFTKAKEAVDDLSRLAGKIEDYMPLMGAVLEAVDEAEGAAVKVAHDGAPGVWIPADEWAEVKHAYRRAW